MRDGWRDYKYYDRNKIMAMDRTVLMTCVVKHARRVNVDHCDVRFAMVS